ncbi:hypothetical protein DVH24_011238 [Malus domestica]|uniref:Reverse transcriptase Ty1/copia-type domain-containing protein n=1 Tax=Malus domestica TaxID=3750 RepID=A0A498JY52_MALDO|nr:hypothetical protein DVH24_011238 [Malus domestica]
MARVGSDQTGIFVHNFIFQSNNQSYGLVQSIGVLEVAKKLIYLSLTCSDIAYAVSVNQFMLSPNEGHIGAVMRILGYLKSARPGKGLMFKKHLVQPVAQSSAKAKYRGIAHGICELLWLRWLLSELGFKPKGAMRPFCNNQTARAIVDNPI